MWSRRRTAAYVGTNGNYLSVVFFVGVALFGIYIVLSLFMAILLERFKGRDSHELDLEPQGEEVRPSCSPTHWRPPCRVFSHSISFTRAQGIPECKIGFGRGKDGRVGEGLVEGGS